MAQITVKIVMPRWVFPVMWLAFYLMMPILALAYEEQEARFIDVLANWAARWVRIETV